MSNNTDNGYRSNWKVKKLGECFLYWCSNRMVGCTEIYSGNILELKKEWVLKAEYFVLAG